MFNKKIINLSICIIFLSVIFSGCIGPQAEETKEEVMTDVDVGEDTNDTAVVRADESFWDLGLLSLIPLSLRPFHPSTTPVQMGIVTNQKEVDGDCWFVVTTPIGVTINVIIHRACIDHLGIDTNWKSLSICGYFAIRTDGTLWVLKGRNHLGQMGLGHTNCVDSADLPIQIGTDTWKYVSSSRGHRGHTLAIKTDGTLWAWGCNSYGQLGLGHRESRTSPTQVGIDTWKYVASSEGYTLAIKTDGTLWAWGCNSYGQLGMGHRESRTFPTQVGTDTNWERVFADSSLIKAIRTDGTFWGWGGLWRSTPPPPPPPPHSEDGVGCGAINFSNSSWNRY